MNKEMLIFDDNGIDKHKLHYYKNPILIEDNDKILISNKVSFGKKGYKNFIGYKDDDYEIHSLHIMLPKMSGYVKSVDEYVFFT